MRTWRWLAVAVLVIAAILGGIILLIWWRDWWPSDAGDQWGAVSALGTAMTALIAFGGLAALWLARAQLVALRRQTRIEFAPYLRVDLSLDVPGGQWTPPEVDAHYQLTEDDLDPLSEPRDLFQEWRSADEVDVLLWVSNQQAHPSGVARWIVVDVVFETPLSGTESATHLVSYAVFLHYVERGKAIRYSLGRVDRNIPYLSGRIVDLAYSGMTGDALSLGHGSTEFEWDGRRLRNRRGVLLGSEDREYGY